MGLHLIYKRGMVAALVMATAAMASANRKTMIESVKAMERDLGLTITTRHEIAWRVERTQQISDNYALSAVAISPDGTAIAWGVLPIFYRAGGIPFLTVESLKQGIQPVQVEGRVVAGSLGLSSEAHVIVVLACSTSPSTGKRELVVVDRRSGIVVHDLTRFVTEFELGSNVEQISVSGPGTLAALGTRERIQVLEIPSGKTVYAGPGRFPRLSPDGKRLAFVNDEKLWISSFAEGTTVPVRRLKRVKGVGGWSPDGRFLLAGAWTRSEWLAIEKRKIIVDTTTGEYAVIGKLGEGDYGSQFAWVSAKLLTR